MADDTFNIEAFDDSIACILTDCKYINLPFELPGVCNEINFLLTKCGQTFFRRDYDKDLNLPLQQCLLNANIALDLSWEKLNSGYWKDVDKNWRHAYTLASLFKVLCLLKDKNTRKQDIIKACDMGLLMGAPLMNNILSRIAYNVSTSSQEKKLSPCEESKKKKAKIDLDSEKYRKLLYEIAEIKDMSYDEFVQCYMEQSRPVILLEVMREWPALSTNPWSVDSILDKARYRTVPIEIGSKYTDDSWTQKLMTVEEFIEKFIWNKSCQRAVGYLAQYDIFNQIPELYKDIKIPWYITRTRDEKDVDISIYFGPEGTVSPLHYDPKHNLLAQVIGEKYIRLYSKKMTEYLYPREGTWLSNTSQVDVDEPDLKSFPLFNNAQYEECILKPGSILYIPPGCWHYVRSLSVSLSISFWWEKEEGNS